MTALSSSAPAKECLSTSIPPNSHRCPQAGPATTSSTPTASRRISTSMPPTPSPSSLCPTTAQSRIRIRLTSPNHQTPLINNTNSTTTPAPAATKCPPLSATPTPQNKDCLWVPHPQVLEGAGLDSSSP